MKIKLLWIVALLLMVVVPVNAEEEVIYRLANATQEGYQYLEDEFASFRSANRYYNRNKDDYDNLVLFENEEVILMEYGIVEFKVNDGCTLNLDYHDVKHNADNTINGCYGVEGAYLGSEKNTNRVYFMISDSVGYTNRENVVLHPFDNLKVRISRYTAKDDRLYHEIKTQLSSDFYSSSILLDEKPTYLENDKTYYSYDGHYFYRGFKEMIDDYHADAHTNAINPNNPYYNYFEYLPHRSLSNYSDSEIENYLENVLFFDRKLDHYSDTNGDRANDEVNRSQYFNEASSFFANQQLYGVNAMMMLSLSINESSFGKSKAAFNDNNLFGHAAFDTEIERESGRYLNVASSIYSHAKHYISGRYCNPEKNSYYGSFFGNKNSGMNVDYTSDPYWGEKAASYYFTLDGLLGKKDYQSYTLGLVEEPKDLIFYKNSELTEELMTIKQITPYSSIILEELSDSYKVQFDANIGESALYDFEKNVAYVSKDMFDHILNKDALHGIEYCNITFDANGGQIDNFDQVSIKVEKNQLPPMIRPTRQGYEFAGYSQMIRVASRDETYVAQYNEIKSIEMLENPKRIVELNKTIDLSNGLIKVVFADESYKEMPLTTDMIRGFDPNVEGVQTVIVDYCGVQTSFEVEVNGQISIAKKELDQDVDQIVEQYNKSGDFNTEELFRINDNLALSDLYLTFEEVTKLDQMLIEKIDNEVRFNIDENDKDMSISGLAFASLAKNSLNNSHPFFIDTYSLKIGNLSNYDYQRLKGFGDAYGFTSVEGFTLNLKKNAQTLKVNLPYVIQLKVDDMDTHKLYTVYHMDEMGDVRKCATMQTKDYIRFMSNQDGSYMIFSIDSANDYQIDNLKENVDSVNSEQVYYLKTLNYSFYALLIVLIAISNVRYKMIEKKGLTTWKDYKKSLRNVELPQEEKPKN